MIDCIVGSCPFLKGKIIETILKDHHNRILQTVKEKYLDRVVLLDLVSTAELHIRFRRNSGLCLAYHSRPLWSDLMWSGLALVRLLGNHSPEQFLPGLLG
jgi:hypothetical protein